MEYQYFGRAQRPKGVIIKQALKVILVFAVGSWLLYEIKHSRNNAENYGHQVKLDGGYEAAMLGRKGTPPRLEERALPESGNVDTAEEATLLSSGGDDVSDGVKEDKAEEEFGHINEKISTREEVEHEPESQSEVSSKKKYKDSFKTKSEKAGLESRRSELSHKEHGNGIYTKRQIINDFVSNEEEKVQFREELNDLQFKKSATSDLSEKENDGDEELRIREKETRMQKNMVEGTKNAEVIEEIEDVQSFHDENGVPPDVNETEIVFGQAHILREENISNVSKGSWIRKNIYKVPYVEDNTAEVNLESSKNDDVEEINTGITTHVDTSGIKSNSEIGEGDS